MGDTHTSLHLLRPWRSLLPLALEGGRIPLTVHAGRQRHALAKGLSDGKPLLGAVGESRSRGTSRRVGRVRLFARRAESRLHLRRRRDTSREPRRSSDWPKRAKCAARPGLRRSAWTASRSKPVAMTVTLTISPIVSSMLAPKMMFASSCACSWTSARGLLDLLMLACRGRRRC